MKKLGVILGVCLMTAAVASSAVAGDKNSTSEPGAEMRHGLAIEVRAYMPPETVRQPLPYYRQELKDVGVQGSVVLKGTIDKSGKVEGLRVVEGHPLLAQAATDAVNRWQYRPARVYDRVVPVDLTVYVNFQLRHWPHAKGGNADATVAAVSVTTPASLETGRM